MAIEPVSKPHGTTQPENNKFSDEAKRNPQKQDQQTASDDNNSSKPEGIKKNEDGNILSADVTA